MECEIEIDVDGSMPDLFNQKIVTARKKHQCCECEKAIKKSEEYELTKGKWDDEFLTHKTCLTCCEIRDELFCSYIFTEIYDTLSGGDFELSLDNIDRFSPKAQQKLIEKLIIDHGMFDED